MTTGGVAGHLRRLRRVHDIVAKQLAIAPGRVLTGSLLVEELGADECALGQLALALEDAFEIDVSDDDIAKMVTVGDVSAYVGALLEAKALGA